MGLNDGPTVKSRNPVVRRQSTDRPELWPHRLQRWNRREAGTGAEKAGGTEDIFRSFQRLPVVGPPPPGTVVKDLPLESPPLMDRPTMLEDVADNLFQVLGDTSRNLE